MRETLIDGQTGSVVPQGDLQAMASTVATLSSDTLPAALEVGKAGRAFVTKQLSTEATVTGYLRVLEKAPC